MKCCLRSSSASDRPLALEALKEGAALHGLLNLDKPPGVTSQEVVQWVKRLLPRKTKVGHAGTLDPLATGVLVIGIGAATRLVDRIQEYLKGYRAGLRFGIRSDTDDITGQITPGGDPADIASASLVAALQEFEAQLAQVPPKYSAVHVAGRRAYDLARSNQDFELSARPVQIESATLVDHANDSAEIDIVCGSGTYVRSIIRDLGERLDCGAVMTTLVRTFVGPFQLADAVSLGDLTQESLPSRLLPLRSVLSDDATYMATAAQCTALLQGRGIGIPANSFLPDERVVILDVHGELFAFARWNAESNMLMPQRVFFREDTT